MVMHARSLGLALGLGLLGCGPKSATTTPPTAAVPPAASVKPADAELLAVADSVDPGPQAPLFTELPPAIRGPIERALGTTVDNGLATREIRDALQVWDRMGTAGGETITENLMRLGVGLVRAERAVAAGDVDAELLLALSRVYSILDTPMFAGQGMFQQILQMAGRLAQSAGPGAGADLAGLSAGLARVFSRAGALHRRNAAEFLRHHGEHPEVPRVLGRLAEDASRREEFARSLALRQMAMRRQGSRASAADHVDLATACYRALELGCGDAALKRARELGVDASDVKAATAHARRMQYATKRGEQARRVLEIPADAALAEALERGHLLLLLDRFADAAALYERLRIANPNDARPRAGLAKLAIQRSGDFSLASAQIDLGKALASKDRDFYEVALGTVGMKFLYEALPAVASGRKFDELVGPLLADLRAFAGGLRTYDPARAGVVEVIEAVVAGIAPGFLAGDPTAAVPVLRGALARAVTNAASFPDSPDARRMVYLAANFSADRDAALAAVRAPLSAALAGDIRLQRARAQTWLDVAVAWEAEAELPGLEAVVMATPEEEGERSRVAMHAAVLALKSRRTGAREAGEQAVAMYAVLASEGSAAARAVALNNLGVLKIRLGDPVGGVQHLVEALNLDASARPAALNLAATVLSLEGAQRAELIDAFSIVARDGTSSALRLQANAWRYEQALKGSGDVEQTRADFVAALARERKAEVRGTLPMAHWGLISAGTVQVSFNYSVPDGFQIRNEIDMALWLIEPAPSFDVLLAAAEQPVKPVKPAKPAKPIRPAR